MAGDHKKQLAAGVYNFDDLAVGDKFQTGRICVTEAHIVNFAGLSGDFFDVHMDDEFAVKCGFPKRIAHGLLVLILIDGLKNRADVKLKAVASLGWEEWDFKAPIFAGDSIHATIEILQMRRTSKLDRGIVKLGFTVFNQHGALVQCGTNKLLMPFQESPDQATRQAPKPG